MTNRQPTPAVSRHDLPYRPCVGVMLFNAQGRVWVGRRADMPGEPEGRGDWWQMPQGGIDTGEEPAVAALRELHEETCIQSAHIIGESADWYRYDLPDHLVGVAWQGRYRGQEQKWFALRFTGSEDEINIDAPCGHKAEFDAWRWIEVGDLVPLIVPFKKPVYERVVAEFGHLRRA